MHRAKQVMKLISFNINGIKSMTGKLKNGEKKGGPTTNGIKTLVEEQQPDVLCFQEVKTQSDGDLAWLKTHFPFMYTSFSTIKKGYSGVALLSKKEPEWITKDMGPPTSGIKEYHQEGRIITAKFATHIIVTIYTPNAQPELARIKERVEWEQELRTYLKHLQDLHKVPILLCGDMNCVHQPMDIHNPKMNKKTPGYSVQEQTELQALLDSGWTDSFRHVNPAQVAYTYWSNFAQSRARNKGWRIDYVMVSKDARSLIRAAECLPDYHGSDHCPVSVTMEFTEPEEEPKKPKEEPKEEKITPEEMLDRFWKSMEGKEKPNQLQRYEAKGSPESIKKFIAIGGGPKMGTTLEQFARFRFPTLQKRSKGKDQTGYDHLIQVGNKTVYVEQKSSGHWGESDFKWQHVEDKHMWNILLLCGIGYQEVHFWGMNRATFQQLIQDKKITNQGNKAADSSEGMWFNYSDVKEALTRIETEEDLQRFASLL